MLDQKQICMLWVFDALLDLESTCTWVFDDGWDLIMDQDHNDLSLSDFIMDGLYMIANTCFILYMWWYGYVWSQELQRSYK